MIDCSIVGYEGFSTKDERHYGVYFDDNGLYTKASFNKCAQRFFSKCPDIFEVNSGTFLTGNYIIFKYELYTEEQNWLDMDVTPKEFIKLWNTTVYN